MSGTKRHMTPQEHEASQSLGHLLADFVDFGRGAGISTDTLTAHLETTFVKLLNAVRAPLYEQAAEQRRHIEALEAKVQSLEARLP